MKLWIVSCALAAAISTPALAAPGVGGKVYGATLSAGTTELESRYGRLMGKAADGEDALKLEISHAFSNRFAAGVLIELEREPNDSRKLTEFAFEAIATLGHVDALDLDVALYAEYAAKRFGPDALEGKLLLQHRQGPFDGRLNLKVEKELESGEPLELGYAASVDWAAFGEFRLGAQAFGNLGSTRNFLPRDEHFAGPVIKTEIEHLPGKGELEIEAGYLFALGAAREEARGQLRVMLEYEFHF